MTNPNLRTQNLRTQNLRTQNLRTQNPEPRTQNLYHDRTHHTN